MISGHHRYKLGQGDLFAFAYWPAHADLIGEIGEAPLSWRGILNETRTTNVSFHNYSTLKKNKQTNKPL